MAGVLIGQDAVDELERQLGRTPTDIERQIAMEEGYRPTVGKDNDGRAIIGFGQTGDFKNQTLDKVANIFEKRTQRLIPNYNMLPDFVKNRAFDATYRGTLGQSPMTVDLMNMGQYGDAADEFLDNQEYRDAVLSGSGVAARMERTADAFREYGNQDNKQVVPQMATSNKVDPRLLYEQRLAEAKQAQQRADLNRLQSVHPIDMNGGQVDPRGFTQVVPQITASPNQQSNNGFLSPAAQAAIAQTQGDPRNRTTNRSNVAPATIPLINSNANIMRNRTHNRASVAPATIQQQSTGSLSPAAQAAIAQVQNAPAQKVPSLGDTIDPHKKKGITPYTFMPSVSSIFVDPIFDSAAETAKKFGGQVGGVVDNITAGASAYGDMVAGAIDNTLNNTSGIASGFAEGFSNSDTPTTVAPIQQKPPVTNQQQALLSGNNDTLAPVIPPADVAEQLKVLKAKEDANPEGESRQGPVPGNRKQPVPPIPETLASITRKAGEEFDSQQTGSSDASSYSPDGSIKDGNGDEVIQTEEEKERNKGIFDKASELFGDIFTSADLKRMVLYTVGGLITGGSMEGSFKWAGMQVMKENGINEQNQATRDAAALATRERKEAVQEATLTRARETFIANKVDEFKLEKKQKHDIKVAADLADYNLGVKRITEGAKAPDGLKLKGVNYEVQGKWSGDAWINTSNKTVAGVKPGQKFPSTTSKWNSSLHDPSSSGMRDRFVKIAEDLQDGTEDADGKPNTLGDSAVNSYSKFRAWVDEKAKDQGYYLDLNDPLAEQVYRISVKQAIDANAGKKSGKAGGMVTPESFFDGSLIRGYLGGQGADVESLFTDINRKPINVKTNDRLIGDIELHRKKMQQRSGGNYTTAQATHNFWTAWNNTEGTGITDDQRNTYNKGAGPNVSGFSKFVREYTIKDAAKQ